MKKILFVISILFWGINCGKIWAMAPGVYLSPPFKDVKIEGKNKEVSFDLLVGNNSPAWQSIELSVVDFGSLDDSGGVAFLSANNNSKDQKKYSLASWISIQKNRLNLAPGTKESVKIIIINKDSLSPGGHYGAVLATVKNEETNQGDTVGINQSLASLIYVMKTGGEKRDLTLNQIDWKRNIFSLEPMVELKFGNGGNVHVVPKGVISLTDAWGRQRGRAVINDGSFKVLPESYRWVKIKMEKNNWLNWPGRYELKVDYRFDSDQEFKTKKTSFIYFGKEGVFLTFLAVMVISMVAYKFLPNKSSKK